MNTKDFSGVARVIAEPTYDLRVEASTGFNVILKGSDTFNTLLVNDDHTVTVNGPLQQNGLATFDLVPQCSIAPTGPSDLTNKAYVDSVAGGSSNLSEVLTNGNDADGQSMINLNTIRGTAIPSPGEQDLTVMAGTGDLVLGTRPFGSNVSAMTIDNSTSVATFSQVPVCATQPSSDTQLANKQYVDSVAGGGGIITTGATAVITGTGNTLETFVYEGVQYTTANFITGGTFRFTNFGTLDPNPTIDFLIASGGGGGGGPISGNVPAGGGGGAGGLGICYDYPIRVNTTSQLTITVGGGGNAGTSNVSGSNGGNSSLVFPVNYAIHSNSATFSTVGGAGGTNSVIRSITLQSSGFQISPTNLQSTAGLQFFPGGSFGGLGGNFTAGQAPLISTTTYINIPQQFSGLYGETFSVSCNNGGGFNGTQTGGGGGGGGAMSRGQGGNPITFGTGGSGKLVKDFLPNPTFFCAGGGGGRRNETANIAPPGVFGNVTGGGIGAWFGSNSSIRNNATNPLANSGSGGGGGSQWSTDNNAVANPSSGAGGRVLIRFRS